MTARKKIPCPIDFSAGSEKALATAADLARYLAASIELVHVYQVPGALLPGETVTEISDHIRTTRKQALDSMAKQQQGLRASGLEASLQLLEGFPAGAILEHAKHGDFSMIVMGTHARSGVPRFFLGSVAEQVIRHASVPVVSVRLAD